MCTSPWKRCPSRRRRLARRVRSVRRWAGEFRRSRRWRRLRGRFARLDSITQSRVAGCRACRVSLETCGALLFLRWRRSRHGFLAVDVFVFDVALGVGVDGGLVGAGQGALDLAGVAYYEAVGRDFGALEEQGAGGYDAAGADFYAVEDDGAP